MLTDTRCKFKPGDRVRYTRPSLFGRFLATVTEALVERSTGSVRFFYRIKPDDAYPASIKWQLVPEKWLEAVGPLEELAFCGG